MLVARPHGDHDAEAVADAANAAVTQPLAQLTRVAELGPGPRVGSPSTAISQNVKMLGIGLGVISGIIEGARRRTDS